MKMAKQIISPTTTTTTTQTAAQAYAQAYALALTAVKARKAAEAAAKQAQEMKEEEREAKRMVRDMTQPQATHAPITLDEVDDTPATSNSINAAQWIIAASLALGAILFLIYIITISIH